jgi:hypothetical protein
MVELIGGGGGISVGTCIVIEGVPECLPGGPGGGGAYTKTIVTVTPGATYNIVVGQAGTIGNSTTSGTDGGQSLIEDGADNILAFANGGVQGSGSGPGAGGPVTNNSGLFASLGVAGAKTLGGAGYAFVPGGTVYGTGANEGSQGGGDGAVVIWW